MIFPWEPGDFALQSRFHPPRALRLDTDFCSGDQSPKSDAVPLANWAQGFFGGEIIRDVTHLETYLYKVPRYDEIYIYIHIYICITYKIL